MDGEKLVVHQDRNLQNSEGLGDFHCYLPNFVVVEIKHVRFSYEIGLKMKSLNQQRINTDQAITRRAKQSV